MTNIKAHKFQSARLATKVSGDSPVDARVFQVDESLSSLFGVHLEVVSDNPDLALDAIIGRPAEFALLTDEGTVMRRWVGICKSIEQVDVEDTTAALSTYEMTIVPEMWFLTQRRNHRIFQQKSEPQIVIQLLEEWGLDVDVQLDVAAYATREYRVQYAESDFDFVSRMLEDAGITYFFREGQVVLSDAPQRRELVATLPYSNAPTAVTSALATEVRLMRQVRPGRYTQRDIDHRRPPDFPVIASQADGLDPESRLERFHYTPGAFLFQQDAQDGSPVGDDRGTHRKDLTRGADQVQRRLEAKRGSARVVMFRAHECALAPADVVAFTGHPRRDLSPDRHLLIVSASFHGFATGEWSHRLEARFTDIAFRPAINTPKPRVNGIESATVVGPAGEEIHVDELGRVRVHFHWDRESQMNENSSCWVPVSHAWGGAGYGAVNLPRIGQEVIIDFLGGDPDRPIVVGRVYTGVQQVPYSLPANKTQSGLKSYSSPATGGYNEVMFEDAAGQELLRIQAERDLSSLVKNDENTEVRRNSTSIVGRDEFRFVGGDHTQTIQGSRLLHVEGEDHRIARGDLTQRALEGVTRYTSTNTMHIRSDTEIVMRVGESYLWMQPHRVTLKSPRVHINPPEGRGQVEHALRAIARHRALAGNP